MIMKEMEKSNLLERFVAQTQENRIVERFKNFWKITEKLTN